MPVSGLMTGFRVWPKALNRIGYFQKKRRQHKPAASICRYSGLAA